MAKPPSSTPDPRLAFRSRSRAPEPSVEEEIHQRITRGDEVLKMQSMVSPDMEKLLAAAVNKLKAGCASRHRPTSPRLTPPHCLQVCVVGVSVLCE